MATSKIKLTEGEGKNIATYSNSEDSVTKEVQRMAPNNSAGEEIGGLNLRAYDYVARVLTNSTTETYTFKTGGSGGTTVNTVVIVYTDSSLETISSVTKT